MRAISPLLPEAFAPLWPRRQFEFKTRTPGWFPLAHSPTFRGFHTRRLLRAAIFDLWPKGDSYYHQMIISKVGSRLHPKLTIWHHSKFFQEVLHSKCIIDRCTCSKIICCTSSKKFWTMCDEHLALFCRSFMCPLTERSRLFMSIQLMFRVLCSEHMGKTNLTILAVVADRPSCLTTTTYRLKLYFAGSWDLSNVSDSVNL